MARKFMYDGKEIQDPDPNMSTEEVRQWAAEFYPELSNAETKSEKKGEDTIYTFNKRVGTKGSKVEIEMPNDDYCLDEDGEALCPCLHTEGRFCQLLSVELFGSPEKKDADCPSLKQKKCRLGYCAVKGDHYNGGYTTVIEKINQGICPICGGPAEKNKA